MSANLPAPAVPPGTRRAEQLLADMYKVFSHDLPNQLVVVHSLVSLLEIEEMERLSPDGHEYIARLKNACQKAGDLVDFLKQMARVQKMDEPLECVHLAHLKRALRAELAKLHPRHALTWSATWHVPEIQAGRHALQRALAAMIGDCLARLPATDIGIALASLAEATHVELRVVLGAVAAGVLEPHAFGQPGQAPARESHAVHLARALLATWGAALAGPILHDGAWHFTIFCPRAG